MLSLTAWDRLHEETGHTHPHVFKLGPSSYIAIHGLAVDLKSQHGGHSAVVCIFSSDCVTWTEPATVIYDEDYSNLIAGVYQLDSGRLVVWITRRSTVYGEFAPIDCGYVYSDDDGATWSSYVSRGGLIPGYFGFITEVKRGSTFYAPAWAYSSIDPVAIGDQFINVSDGLNLTSTIVPIPTAVSRANQLNENELAAIGDVWVLVSRTEDYTKHGSFFTLSQDGGQTWGTCTNVPLPNRDCHSHPHIFASGGRFYYLVGDRDGSVGEANQKLWMYSSTPERLVANIADWDLEASFDRPHKATVNGVFYGYPITADVLDAGTRLLSVTDLYFNDQALRQEYEYLSVLSGIGFDAEVLATPTPSSIDLAYTGTAPFTVERRVVT